MDDAKPSADEWIDGMTTLEAEVDDDDCCCCCAVGRSLSRLEAFELKAASSLTRFLFFST